MPDETKGTGTETPAPSPADVEAAAAAQRDVEVVNIMQADDPFTKLDAGPPLGEPADKKTNDTTPAAAPEGGTPQSPEPGTPTPPAAPSEVDALQEALRQKDAVIANLSSRPSTPAAPTEVKSSDDLSAEEALKQYDFNIPAQLAQLINSENPEERMKGISMLSGGLARAVHTGVVNFLQKRFDAVPTQINQALQQYGEMQRIKQDFYGTYTVLNKPEYYPWIQSVAQQVWRETSATAWTPDLRDKIADRIATTWGIKREQLKGAGPATPQPLAVVTPTPPADLGGGSRPGGGINSGTPDPNSPQAVEDALFGPVG